MYIIELIGSPAQGTYVNSFSNKHGQVIVSPWEDFAMFFKAKEAAEAWAKRYLTAYKYRIVEHTPSFIS